MNGRRLLILAAVALLLLGAAAGLSGCASDQAAGGRLVQQEQPQRDGLFPLAAGSTLGQTFLPRYAGLSGIAVYLEPREPGNGSLVLSLADDIRAEIPLSSVDHPGYYRFDFPPLADSVRRDLYYSLVVQGDGSVWVGRAPGYAYLHGAAYRDGEAQEAQLTFRLVYDRGTLLVGLLKEMWQWAGLLLAGGAAFLLPGAALLRLLWPGWEKLDWMAKAGLSAGAGAALYPLLFLWTGIAGLNLGPVYAWLPAGAALLYYAWRLRRVRLHSPRLAIAAAPPPEGLRFAGLPRLDALPWPDLAFLAALGLLILTRLWPLRSLDFPMWGDSYQHTLIVQLLIDHGGLFQSWEPYASIPTFTYHFGFHSLAAVFHWLTGLEAPASVLWTGQILNVLAVLGLAPLANRLAGSRWGGAAALVVAGLLAPTPMVYLNWGRYTQLASQVILPAVAFVAWSHLDPGERSPKRILLAALLAGGLALTHYRVVVFAALFYLVVFVGLIFARRASQEWRSLAWTALGAGLLAAPWLFNLARGMVPAVLAYLLQASASPSQAEAIDQVHNSFGALSTYLPMWMWVLLPVAAGWGLWRRAQGAALIAAWSLLALLSANPGWVGLPGTGAIGSFTVFILSYFPAGVLIGAAVVWAGQWLGEASGIFPGGGKTGVLPGGNGKIGILPYILAAAALVIAAVLGARLRLAEVRIAESALVTRPDLRAARWIEANTSPQDRFLVNSLLAWGGTTPVGTDAGWWLPYLSGRRTVLPPGTVGFEQQSEADPLGDVVRLIQAVAERGPDDPQALELLRGAGIDYVYIGQQDGRVGNAGPDRLDPQRLLSSPHYALRYHEDRVWVFELLDRDQ